MCRTPLLLRLPSRLQLLLLVSKLLVPMVSYRRISMSMLSCDMSKVKRQTTHRRARPGARTHSEARSGLAPSDERFHDSLDFLFSFLI